MNQTQTSELSGRIVNFVGSLYPLYGREQHEGLSAARNLKDGTLLLPVLEDVDNENGDVKVLWQGDPTRTTVTRGVYIATLAIAAYAELAALMGSKQIQQEYAEMADHFTGKTGESLCLANDGGGREKLVLEMLGDVSKRLGAQVTLELAKKAIGL